MDPDALLRILQHGDSAFPSGGFAFSWGLEGLAAAGLVTGPETLAALMTDLLRHRWQGFDRVAVRAAWSARDAAAEAAIDAEVDRATWSAPARAGSIRAGRALLSVHARLGGAAAARFREAAEGSGRGHLPVAQGVVWREAGLGLAAAEALSAWALVQGAAAAAVRLGLVGHLAAQAAVGAARAEAADLLARPAPARLCAFTPVVEIALTRHARSDARLFAT